MTMLHKTQEQMEHSREPLRLLLLLANQALKRYVVSATHTCLQHLHLVQLKLVNVVPEKAGTSIVKGESRAPAHNLISSA